MGFLDNEGVKKLWYKVKALVANHTQGEATLTWGGKNFSGAYGCIDAAMIPTLGANRLAFINGDAIKIEYSRDSGSTWTDYTTSADAKAELFGEQGSWFAIGKADSNNKATDAYMLRVTIDTDKAHVYTQLHKFALYISSGGSKNCYCTIDASLETTPDKWVTFANKVDISGWSGWNIINTTAFITYGNNASVQYGLLRFTFGCGSGSTEYSGLRVSRIMGFGGVGWSTPSNMAAFGTVYSTDNFQNVAFPKNVSAKTVNGGLAFMGGNEINFAKPNWGANKEILINYRWHNNDRTPNIDAYRFGNAGGELADIRAKTFIGDLSGKVNNHTVNSDVPENAKFTDTTYSDATQTTHGLMSTADKKKLDGMDIDTLKKELKAYIDQNSTSFNIDKVYPVGSVYISATGANPNSLIGGTWVEFATGRTLIGYDPSDDDLTETGMTGGEKTHVLTVDELPEHNHSASTGNAGKHTHTVGYRKRQDAYGKGTMDAMHWNTGTASTIATSVVADHSHTVTVGSTGSGMAHNNMPPYITVRMWKRTA